MTSLSKLLSIFVSMLIVFSFAFWTKAFERANLLNELPTLCSSHNNPNCGKLWFCRFDWARLLHLGLSHRANSTTS